MCKYKDKNKHKFAKQFLLISGMIWYRYLIENWEPVVVQVHMKCPRYAFSFESQRSLVANGALWRMGDTAVSLEIHSHT